MVGALIRSDGLYKILTPLKLYIYNKNKTHVCKRYAAHILITKITFFYSGQSFYTHVYEQW